MKGLRSWCPLLRSKPARLTPARAPLLPSLK
eukprot:COSAG01_NODE_36541_length_516_cov_1.023981_1_plen_30_part_10